MPEPLVVTVSHRFSKEEAKRRIQEGLEPVRSQLAAFTTSVEDRWTGDCLDFRMAALGQSITGRIEVMDRLVRVEVLLPGALRWMGAKIAGLIRRRGALMLEKT